jgi:hypothetical protein
MTKNRERSEPSAQRPDLSRSERRETEHVFGPVPPHGPDPTDRLCNEPEVKGSSPTRVYHVHFIIQHDGDLLCKHCGFSFYHATDSGSLAEREAGGEGEKDE